MQTVFLPLFPLRLVAFPGETLNLHIFEPRYKELIRECNEKGVSFGIPVYLEDQQQPVGTEIELLTVHKLYSNGEMDVKTQGLGPILIEEFLPKVENRLYPGGLVRRLEYDLEGDALLNERILEYLRELYQVLQITKPLPPLNSDFNTFVVGHLVGFNLQQEYELLCIPEETRRQRYMLQHLETLIPTAREMEELRRKVQMNGHFRELLPPDLPG